MSNPPFADRRDAGRRLGAALASRGLDHPLVLGIARGGVIIAAEVAALIHGEAGVTVARKLGAPANPELGVGAVAADGTVFLDERLVSATGASPEYLEREIAAEVEEARRRLKAFDGLYHHVAAGRSVIVVDDGIATGVTARAACRALRKESPASLILAAPCAPPSAVEGLRDEADEVVVLVVDPDFMATGQYYRDFRPVSDADVRAALAAAFKRQAG